MLRSDFKFISHQQNAEQDSKTQTANKSWKLQQNSDISEWH